MDQMATSNNHNKGLIRVQNVGREDIVISDVAEIIEMLVLFGLFTDDAAVLIF